MYNNIMHSFVSFHFVHEKEMGRRKMYTIVCGISYMDGENV